MELLSRYSGSTFAKSSLLASDICSELFQVVFSLSQVFMKSISQAEGYDEDKDENRCIESQRKSVDHKDVLPLAVLFTRQSKMAHVVRTGAVFMTQKE